MGSASPRSENSQEPSVAKPFFGEVVVDTCRLSFAGERLMAALRALNLILAFIATTAPLAHVLELPSKLTLDGPLWLAVQQHLYRGWGAVFGPVEIVALALTGVLLAVTWPTGARRTYFLAFACYAAMIAVFFLFNAPVNEALNGWTAATLPTNWSTYRLRWEIGHAFAAALAVIAFVALMRQWKRERTK